MRPNFFVNTPDILHAYLQYGGPAAFKIRAALAATRVAELGRLRRLRAVRARRRAARAARSTSTRRSTRSGSATGTPPRPRAAPSRRTSPGSTRSAAAPRAAAAAQRHRPQHRRRERAGLQQAQPTGRRHRHRRRQPRPARHPRDHRPPRPARPRPRLARHASPSTTRSPAQTGRWGEHNYVRLDPDDEPAHVLTVRRRRRDSSLTRSDDVDAMPERRPDPTGSRRAVFYEVLVRSFRDSNGDGIGDFNGLIEKLDYLAVARRRLPLDPAVLHLAAARRRLRRRRLHRRPPGDRHRRRLPRASSTRPTSAASG